MLKKIFNNKLVKTLLALSLSVVACSVFADGNMNTLSSIASNINTTVSEGAVILQDTSLIIGIALIMAAFFKFHAHKNNPTQVPLSHGFTLLLIGGGLCFFPFLLDTAGDVFLGNNAHIAQVGGSDISHIIGGSTQ